MFKKERPVLCLLRVMEWETSLKLVAPNWHALVEGTLVHRWLDKITCETIPYFYRYFLQITYVLSSSFQMMKGGLHQAKQSETRTFQPMTFQLALLRLEATVQSFQHCAELAKMLTKRRRVFY